MGYSDKVVFTSFSCQHWAATEWQ